MVERRKEHEGFLCLHEHVRLCCSCVSNQLLGMLLLFVSCPCGHVFLITRHVLEVAQLMKLRRDYSPPLLIRDLQILIAEIARDLVQQDVPVNPPCSCGYLSV